MSSLYICSSGGLRDKLEGGLTSNFFLALAHVWWRWELLLVGGDVTGDLFFSLDPRRSTPFASSVVVAAVHGVSVADDGQIAAIGAEAQTGGKV
jgi:hypothetical protein